MSFDLARAQARLPAFRLKYLETTSSTMRDAAGLAPRTIIAAGGQTAGIGRGGHAWHSEPDSGLYVSVVLDPLPAGAFPGITLAIGLAVREAIEQCAGIACDLRWPNDLLIDGRKVAGILVQADSKSVIAGIGVNVNQTTFPEDLAGQATSLRLAGALPPAREDLLVAVMEAITRHSGLIAEQGMDPILRLFAQFSSYACGRRVSVEQVTGTTAGLDEHGFLLLKLDNGKRITILAGGVRPA
jgi:BirA family biotin operon repressor/biotin-[acetyl-CoA-carboxylase] ligase